MVVAGLDEKKGSAVTLSMVKATPFSIIDGGWQEYGLGGFDSVDR